DRVPSLGEGEAEAESLEGGQRTVDQRNDDAAEQQQHGEGGGAGGVAQHRIPDAVPAQGVGGDLGGGGERGHLCVRIHGTSLSVTPNGRDRHAPVPSFYIMRLTSRTPGRWPSRRPRPGPRPWRAAARNPARPRLSGRS